MSNITGCQDEIEKQMPTLAEGPLVNFTFSGICDGSTTNFSAQTDNNVLGYSWNFGDNASSTIQNPGHQFLSTGDYTVKLVVQSPSGCNNSATKIITIYSKPFVDFSIQPPPFSCSGSETGFTNNTVDPSDSNIATWLWNFGDAASENTSVLRDPSHTFINSGNYNVMLTATTDAGCINAIEKSIFITQSPSVTISNTPTCRGVPVAFNAVGAAMQSYYWEMGTSFYTIANPTHTFNAAGNFPVKLIVLGNNNCQTVSIKNITVPATLTPDFSVVKNCKDNDAVFTDITTTADPIVQHNWNFAGLGNASGSPATFLFNSTGSKSVTLNVTTEAGCNYSRTKSINIVPAPQADFNASPELGAAPLNVQFTNTSAAATQYQWSFGDGSSSNITSPLHTYTQLGSYTAELTSTNAEGCSSSISKSINVIVPFPDIEIKTINLTENTGQSVKAIITLHNKGNTIIKDLPLDIDISGKVKLREVVKESIQPSALYNVILSYSIVDAGNLSFLCMDANLQDDVSPEGNRLCIDLNENTFLFAPYPNPVTKELRIDWVAPEGQAVEIFLIDPLGKTTQSIQATSVDGLNELTYDVQHLRSGMYILKFQSGSISQSKRVMILREN